MIQMEFKAYSIGSVFTAASKPRCTHKSTALLFLTITTSVAVFIYR